jgi:hypothetical protein
MPLGVKDKGDATTSRSVTRKRNGSLTTPDELQEIKNSADGRRFLEKFSLLCPPGEPPSIEAISICLHQIAAMPGLSRQTVNAVRAAAFLLEELGENCVNETVKDAFDSQITEFTSDMKMLVEHVNEKIDNHLQVALEQITKATEASVARQAANVQPPQPMPTASQANTYASALINPPAHVNPKLAAKEGIKARQFLLQGLKETKYGKFDTQKLKAELNRIAKDGGMKEGKIRSVIAQKDDSILIEVDSDSSAKWFTDSINRVEFCGLLGDHVSFRTRAFNVLAFNVPLTVDPRDFNHRAEINEVNDLEDLAITALRWAKPLNRRSPQQKSAHLVLTFNSSEAANHAISNGITICHKKCHVERVKKEPLRCLKCQGWNHMARDCPEMFSTCGNCAGEHKTADCPTPRARRCVSCQSNSHASWSRECPTFLRRVRDFNERNPENLLPFFPTADPWTWSTGDTNPPAHTNSYSSQNAANRPVNAKTNTGKARAPPGKGDTYIPEHERHWEPHPTSRHNSPPSDDWWQRQMTGVGTPSGQSNTENAPTTSQPRASGSRTNVGTASQASNSGNAGPSNLNSHA